MHATGTILIGSHFLLTGEDAYVDFDDTLAQGTLRGFGQVAITSDRKTSNLFSGFFDGTCDDGKLTRPRPSTPMLTEIGDFALSGEDFFESLNVLTENVTGVDAPGHRERVNGGEG